MKRIMTFLCAAVLVGAVGTMFAACEGEGDSEHGQAQEEPQLPPEDPEEPEEPKIPEELSKYDNYYRCQGEKIPVEIVDNKFYVLYYADDDENFKSGVEKAGATMTDDTYFYHRPLNYDRYLEASNYVKEIFSDYYIAHIEGDREKLSEVLASAICWAPYCKIYGNEGYVRECFSVCLKSTADLPGLEKLARDNSVEILGRVHSDDFWKGWYDLACTNHSKGNALEMANLFYETGLFKEAGPDFGGFWVED